MENRPVIQYTNLRCKYAIVFLMIILASCGSLKKSSAQSISKPLSKADFDFALKENTDAIKALYKHDDSITMNGKHITTNQKKVLDSLNSKFIENPTTLTQKNLEKEISNVSFDNDIKIIVKFTTKKAEASVLYASIRDRDLTPCDQSTNNCVVNLPIGKCLFFSERNGKKTSKIYEKTFYEDTNFEIQEDEQ